ncbi:uncharacterized protein RSE6_03683 [Rhynchosporium secalis]|uniref:Uncharacterized protein n=1 Tax=Rhynchosporium secalis TaxID=38038 RepID=A0A1E1M3D6_RHYSE|nr:uncharacterized protein RSE6_03683 [Rhynchosporium secalis]
MNLVYGGREDSIVDATIASEAMIQRDMIGSIKVYTQDAEGKDDFNDFT